MPQAILRRELTDNLKLTDKEISEYITKDVSRRAAIYPRTRILKDDLVGIVNGRMKLMFDSESFDDMWPYHDVSNNLMQRVIKELSTVYKEEPTRTVKPKSAQKAYEFIIEGIDLNSRLQKANYNLNGLNDLVIMVSTMENIIDLNVYTPDKITIIPNQDNPTIPEAVLIEDKFKNADGKEVTQYFFWSPTRHFIMSDKGEKLAVQDNLEMANPYASSNIEKNAFFPFVFIHNTTREDCFWDEFSGMDLVEGTILVCVQETFLNLMVPMQFKQLGIRKTIDETNKLGGIKSRQLKSPLHIIESNGEINTLDWQSNINFISQCIQEKIFRIATNYGISAENFKLTASETSGFARRIAKERLTEIRKQQIKTWRKAEQDLFEAIREAGKVYSIQPQIPDSATFSIDYVEEPIEDEPQVELDVMERKIELGIISPLDLIRKENPDIKTEEEALEIIEKNIQFRNMIRRKFAVTSTKDGSGVKISQTNGVKQEAR